MNLLANLFGGSAAEDITPLDYAAQFANKEHVLIDVRQPDEYATGHMPGAVLIPLGEIGNRTSEIPTDKPVVLVCASGNRSRFAAAQLARAGYSDLYNLSTGTSGWVRSGHPIER